MGVQLDDRNNEREGVNGRQREAARAERGWKRHKESGAKRIETREREVESTLMREREGERDENDSEDANER